MSILTSIAGPSGAGKTRSFKNLNWDETFVIRPNRKPFSFPGAGALKPWDSETKTGNYIYIDDYLTINGVLKALPGYGKKVIIIDDSTHLLLKQTMDTAKEKGLKSHSPCKTYLIAGNSLEPKYSCINTMMNKLWIGQSAAKPRTRKVQRLEH